IENLSLLFFKHNPQLQFDFPYSASLGHDPGCALLRKKFKEYLFTYCIENGILQDFQDTSKPSNDNTNVVNALQDPFVVKQDPDKNSSQSPPPQINHHCFYGCAPIIPDPEPFNNQTIDELSQTLPSFDPTCYSEDGNLFTYDSTSNLVHDSPNDFNPPLQPPLYSCEFYENDALTPILSTEEPDNSLSMGDEHLDTVPVTKSDELIKSSVEKLVQIPSESEGIPGNMCDVPFHDNSPPLDVSKDQFEDFFISNDNSTSIDDDSFSIDNIEYVEASPPDSELVSLEVMEIVIPKVGRIDDDIILTIKDDILREKLLIINLLIANIEALKDNPTPSSNFMTKSSSTSLNFLLEETNTFDNSLPKSETFCFDLEEISSGSTTTHSDISLPDYEVFYDDHVKEISSGSTTTHSDFSLYDSFIFDLSINPFPPTDRSDFYNSIKYALTVNPNIYVSCIKQFWTTVAVKKVNDVIGLQTLVDKKKLVVTEATIHEALRLEDAEGVECDLSTHTTKYSSPALTQKVFATMRRVGKGFSGVETPLFEGMIVAQQVDEGNVEMNVEGVSIVDVAAEGDVSVTDDVVPTVVEEPSIPSPTPPTPPPQPLHDQPSTSQDKIAQALEITKLKQRVKKLERKNKAFKLKRLMKVGKAQRIKTSDDIVMDDVSKQGRMIADIDADVDVILEDAKEVVVEKSADVLSMQDDDVKPVELQEVVEVVTTAKLITEVVTATSVTITVVAPQLTTGAAPTLTTAPSTARRRKGVVIRDPEESATPSTIVHTEAKSKNKGKGILVEEPKPLKKHAQIKQ
nr:hypothetical protein [Tanacetum cinerariifolium]